MTQCSTFDHPGVSLHNAHPGPALCILVFLVEMTSVGCIECHLGRDRNALEGSLHFDVFVLLLCGMRAYRLRGCIGAGFTV